MAVPTVYGKIIEAAKDGKNELIIEKVKWKEYKENAILSNK